MRDVLFVQGAGEGVHADWDIHLVSSLRRELGPGYDVRYPRMPGEDDREVPVAHVDRYAAAIPHAHVHRLEGRDHQLNNDLSEVAREIRELASRAAGRERK